MTTNDEFWAAAEAGRLVLPECSTCQVRFFPPAPACPACHATSWSWVPTEGVGTVYSHTTCQRPHIAGLDAPYVLAIVVIDDGWTLLTNIVGPGHLEVRVGDRVGVEYEERPVGLERRIAPVFSIKPLSTEGEGL